MVSTLMLSFMGKLRGKLYLKTKIKRNFQLCMLQIPLFPKNNSIAKSLTS